MRDKAEEDEYFLEISEKNKGTKKRIPISDIEELEPIKKSQFSLVY